MRFFRTILAALKEIFEVSAYERFCSREKVEVSRESYASFVRESSEARNQHIVRCC